MLTSSSGLSLEEPFRREQEDQQDDDRRPDDPPADRLLEGQPGERPDPPDPQTEQVAGERDAESDQRGRAPPMVNRSSAHQPNADCGLGCRRRQLVRADELFAQLTSGRAAGR